MPSENEKLARFATEQQARQYAKDHDMRIVEYVTHTRGVRLNVVSGTGKARKPNTLSVINPIREHELRRAAQNSEAGQAALKRYVDAGREEEAARSGVAGA